MSKENLEIKGKGSSAEKNQKKESLTTRQAELKLAKAYAAIKKAGGNYYTKVFNQLPAIHDTDTTPYLKQQIQEGKTFKDALKSAGKKAAEKRRQINFIESNAITKKEWQDGISKINNSKESEWTKKVKRAELRKKLYKKANELKETKKEPRKISRKPTKKPRKLSAKEAKEQMEAIKVLQARVIRFMTAFNKPNNYTGAPWSSNIIYVPSHEQDMINLTQQLLGSEKHGKLDEGKLDTYLSGTTYRYQMALDFFHGIKEQMNTAGVQSAKLNTFIQRQIQNMQADATQKLESYFKESKISPKERGIILKNIGVMSIISYLKLNSGDLNGRAANVILKLLHKKGFIKKGRFLNGTDQQKKDQLNAWLNQQERNPDSKIIETALKYANEINTSIIPSIKLLRSIRKQKDSFGSGQKKLMN